MNRFVVSVYLVWLISLTGSVHADTGLPDAVKARLDGDGRTFTVSANGVDAFRGGFSACFGVGRTNVVLASDSGVVLETNVVKDTVTPYGNAVSSFSTLRFTDPAIELLFRLDTIPGVPVVMLRAGIRNVGAKPLSLMAVTPLAMDERQQGGAGRAGRIMHVSGAPADWLVTGLHCQTPILANFGDIGKPLTMHEYGTCYRGDGVGFLFGPVGDPVSYVSARVGSPAPGRVSLVLSSDMSGVRVMPGQTRWGQDVALFFEPPDRALERWTAWVGQTHGERTAQGALSGWCSWYSLESNVTGKDVMSILGQVVKSGGRLRPSVIQIDDSGEPTSPLTMTPSAKFPEGLPFYAKKIAEAGIRPGVRMKLNLLPASLPACVAEVRQAVKAGFSYLKLTAEFKPVLPGGDKTDFEAHRDAYRELRKAAGENTYILHCIYGVDRAAIGIMDASRTGHDTVRQGVRAVMEEVLRTYPFNGRCLAVDNDVFYTATELDDVSPVVGGWPLARTWISMVGLSCGAAFTSDLWHQDRFKPYWRNIEVLTPPAGERTEVVDLGTCRTWPRLAGHVKREWGDWTVALLWNPAQKEQTVTLDFARIGLEPGRRYAVWSFWDNRYLGMAEGSWTTPFLPPTASQHLCITELPEDAEKPVLIGSGLHVYCGAVEIKRVTSMASAMQIELTDAGARSGDLFVYSKRQPLLREAVGCQVTGIGSAGENVWKISLRDRMPGQPQRVGLDIRMPVTRQLWFWVLAGGLLVSLGFGVWRWWVWLKLQHEHALEQERRRIARDMHDEVGGKLARLSMLGGLACDEQGVGADQQLHLREMTRGVREAASELEQIIWSVNPKHDTLTGLARRILQYAEEFFGDTPVKCRFKGLPEIPARSLRPDLRAAVFSAAKEAFTNVLKHSQATEVSIGMSVEGVVFTIRVADNGCGFDLAGVTGGNGLGNMRDRLVGVGGACDIQSVIGQGTVVCLSWMLDKAGWKRG